VIVDEWVDVIWNSSTKDYYINLGYKYTKLRGPLKVRVEHLTQGSSQLVTVQCDFCGKVIKRPMYRYNQVTKNQTTGYRCRDCFEGNFEKVHSEFLARGLTPLFTEYVNCKETLEYVCKKHPDKVQRTNYDNFSSGRGCMLCGWESTRYFKLSKIEDIKEEFAKDPRGYILLSESYTSLKDKLLYICPKHPQEVMKISLNNYRRGKGCRLCAFDRQRGAGNGNYKGLSTITKSLRLHIIPWVLTALKESNFTCSLTGVRGVPLEVHHEYSFSASRDSALRATGFRKNAVRNELSEEQYSELVKVFENIHNRHAPKVIQKPLHKLFHKYYGNRNNTQQQFEEFASDFSKGWLLFS